MTAEKKGAKSRHAGMKKGAAKGENAKQVFHSRKHPRVPLEMDVEYQNGDKFVRARSKNISKGGIYIKSQKPLSDGAQTTVRFSLDNHKDAVEIKGKVAWRAQEEEEKYHSSDSGMGIEFAEEDEESKKVVGQFVRDISDLMKIMAITSKPRKKRDS